MVVGDYCGPYSFISRLVTFLTLLRATVRTVGGYTQQICLKRIPRSPPRQVTLHTWFLCK